MPCRLMPAPRRAIAVTHILDQARENVMDEVSEPDIVDLGDAKVQTRGPFGVLFEDSPVLPTREQP